MKHITIIFLSLLFYIGANGQTSPGNIMPSSEYISGSNPNITRPVPYDQTPVNSNPVNFNYQRIFIPRGPITNTSSINKGVAPATIEQHLEYTDGWGRTMQKISFLPHNAFDDVVQSFDYRPSNTGYSYMPFAITALSGNTNTFLKSPFQQQETFYNTLYSAEQGAAISKTQFVVENNIYLNKSFDPGYSNIGSNKATTSAVFTNAANEVFLFDDVSKYGWPVKTGTYTAGSLIKKVSMNTDGAWLAEFYDKDGHLVCEKRHIGNTKIQLNEWNDGASGPPSGGIDHYGPGYAWTYYTYDPFGRLRYTISPRAIQELIAASWNYSNTTLISQILQNFCDQAGYDDNGRMEYQQKAGEAEATYFVYDKKDRLVMSQTPQQASDGDWAFLCYDKEDRVIMKGISHNSNSWTYWQSIFNNTYSGTTNDFLYYIFNEGIYHQTSTVLNSGNAYMLEYYDYDDYYRPVGSNPDINQNQNSTYTGVQVVSGGDGSVLALQNNALYNNQSMYPEISTRTKGLLTATRTKVLKGNNAPGYIQPWITNYYYYDEFGRQIQERSLTHTGSWQNTSTQYNFRGQPIRDVVEHNNAQCTNKPSGQTWIVRDYEYNKNKPALTQERFDNLSPLKVSWYNYYNLGRTFVKDIGGIEQQDFEYNLRGQLTAINKDHVLNTAFTSKKFFGEIIGYDKKFANTFTHGKVAGIIWRGADSSFMKSYTYQYDLAGQLTNADYLEYSKPPISSTGSQPNPTWNKTWADYSEKSISYDRNGNIAALKRYGPVNGTTGLIDDLTYHYEDGGKSNRLQYVDDAVTLPSAASYNFTDASGTSDYSYDNNGNITLDNNKGVTIENNTYLNKPVKLNFGGDITSYIYDAQGNKLVEYRTGANAGRYDYVGSFVYYNDKLVQVNNEEGYTTYNDTIFDKEMFFVRDHLGNVRQLLRRQFDGGTVPGWNGPRDIIFEPYGAVDDNILADCVDGVRETKPYSLSTGDQFCAALEAGDATRRIGAIRMLSVMAGDIVDIRGDCYYEALEEPTEDIGPEDMVAHIITTLTDGTTTIGDEIHPDVVARMFDAGNYLGAFEYVKAAQTNTGIPRSYLNYMFFDENMNLVADQSGVFQLAHGAIDEWTSVGMDGLSVKTNGTLVVWISNEDGSTKAYWDNLHIGLGRGQLKEEFHYYPFGLPIGTNPTLLVNNKWLYQTKELNKEHNLYWMDFHARQYDPQLGRFHSVDPAGQFHSGFIGMGNDPVSGIDPDGEWAHIVIGAAIGGAINLGTQIAKGNVHGLGSGLAAFGVGALAGGVGAATFGAGLAVATGGTAMAGITSSAIAASGAGGFSAGFGAGMASGMLSNGILTAGNAIALGDIDPGRSLTQQLMNSMIIGAALGGITGGLGQGLAAYINGKDFWNGGSYRVVTGYSTDGVILSDASAQANKIELKEATAKAAAYTKDNFRKNLVEVTGQNPGSKVHAHHVFPKEFQDRFAEVGINIHNPKYGVWWEASPHLKNAKQYNDIWRSFLRKAPTQTEILNKGREIMIEYGIPVRY